MATVGYLEGTDPLVLTRLVVRGVGTLPVSNGFDNHGKFVTSITERDSVDVVVGYLHKVMHTQRQGFRPHDLLQPCLDSGIAVLIVVTEEDQPAARQLLGQVGQAATLVAPDRLYDAVAEVLGLG
jgi:hypothetical protein